MKQLITNKNQSEIIKLLDLELDPNSSYVLVENGLNPLENCINIFFDPKDLNNVKSLLHEANYYRNRNRNHIVGRLDEDVHLVLLRDVIYIEGINNDTYAHTAKREFSIKEKLYELEPQLIDKKFIRISKSYIVSIHKVEKIKPQINGKLLLFMSNNVKLEVSRHYLPSFKKLLGM